MTTRAVWAAGACVWAASGALGQVFVDLPYVHTRSPEVFREVFRRGWCGEVSAVILGDSQETSPGGAGSVYIPRLNAEFAARYGEAPATPWMQMGSSTGGGQPYADWLYRTASVSQGVTPSAIDGARVPPGLAAVQTAAVSGAGVNGVQYYGNLLMLQHDCASVDPATELRGAREYMRRTAGVCLEVIAGTRAESGEVRLEVSPTGTSQPTFFAPVLGWIDSAWGLEDAAWGVRRGRLGPLAWGSGEYMQVEVSGTRSDRLTDVIAARFVNPGAVGWAMTSLSRGGYKASDVLESHGECGAVLGAMAPDIALVCYGANDAAAYSSAEFGEHLRAVIAFLRMHTRADLPVILVTDPARTSVPNAETAARLDEQALVHYQIAEEDALVCALNSRRLTHEAGWTAGSGNTFTSDGVHYRASAAMLKASLEAGALFAAFGGAGACCRPDVNGDGNVDQDDAVYLIGVLSGGENPAGVDPDYNGDGNADQDDVTALLHTIAGGGCP